MAAKKTDRCKRVCSASSCCSALAAAFPAAGADIVFYESDGFRGRSFVANQTISNFANVGFNDRASSVVIRSGTWQLCSDAFFRGRCVTLAPGEYPTLRSMALENQVSSARELDWLGGGAHETRRARRALQRQRLRRSRLRGQRDRHQPSATTSTTARSR